MSLGPFCVSSNNVFTVVVDLYASELGYYKFAECGDVINPTIIMEVGETYTFRQRDRSNYYHPLGFAYTASPTAEEELEPGIGLGTDRSCVEDLTCPAPMYFLNGEYLGEYSNIPAVKPRTTGADNFGLDDYEPLFFRPMPEWVALGDFSVKLRFDDFSYENDIFYFCHIHQFMAGRIKLTQNGILVSAADNPPLGYEFDQPGEFDRICGTFGLDPFVLPNAQCPHEFVCDPEPENQPFASCIDAMNCAMLVGMTTGLSTRSEVALFIHQMIPHHQNAVNMAKALLITGDIPCADLTDEEDPFCIMQVIIYEIINGQNFQIQSMRGVLESLNYPPEDDCVIPIDSKGGGFVPVPSPVNPPTFSESIDESDMTNTVGRTGLTGFGGREKDKNDNGNGVRRRGRRYIAPDDNQN